MHPSGSEAHRHAPPAPPSGSLLRAPALARLAGAAGIIAALWLAVVWAMR